jgi:hypothetical protein
LPDNYWTSLCKSIEFANRLIAGAIGMQTVSRSARGTARLELGTKRAGLRIEGGRIKVGDSIEYPTVPDEFIDRFTARIDFGRPRCLCTMQTGSDRGSDHPNPVRVHSVHTVLKSGNYAFGCSLSSSQIVDSLEPNHRLDT